jgi:protein SCO1/2
MPFFARHGRGFSLAAALFLVAVSLGACRDDGDWHMTSVSGLLPDLQFDLTRAADGREVTGKTYRGKVALLYFGYTHCPDVCPLTLSHLAEVMGRLGDKANAVRILFLTVDPGRDNLRQMKLYAKAFGPRFVGLRGDRKALDRVVKRYRVSYSLGTPDEDGAYDVTHSSGVFVFDRQGHARLVALDTGDTKAIADDLSRLIAEKQG